MGMPISSSRAAMPAMSQPVTVRPPAPPAPSVSSDAGAVQSLALAKEGNVATLVNMLVK